MILSAYTPAKINWFLSVTGRREDGYHLLNSLFLPLNDLNDLVEIEFSKGQGISLEVSGDIPLIETVPENSDNLCWKAANLFLNKMGLENEVSLKIFLTKKIPIAAGLGGGSSDAACVLKLCNLWLEKTQKSSLSPGDLCETGLKIGADVPFFIDPRPALVEGIGEVIKSYDFQKQGCLLLVNPNFPISAAEAYKRLEKLTPELKIEAGEIEPFNALESGIFRKFPILAIIKEALLDSGAEHVILSGSGPTVFGYYSDQKHAEKAKILMCEKFGPHYQYILTYL